MSLFPVCNASMESQPDKTPQSPAFWVVEESETAMRLDSFLTSRHPDLTRAKIQRAVAKGAAQVDGVAAKSSQRLKPQQSVAFTIPQAAPSGPIPEPISLDIIYEDDHIIGVNKPPLMVVHPAKGHWSGTLTAALAYHFKNLSSVGGATRPGIVHRLDRDTSGIIVIAKTDCAHSRLAEQFEARTVEKKYWALVAPPPDRDRDRIEEPIGIHPYQREKMAIRRDHKSSRSALTFYEVEQRAGRYAQLIAAPKTGRTHQIRVHLSHIGCPIVADKLYSGQNRLTESEMNGGSTGGRVILERQALHALSIQFDHPETGKRIELKAPLASDLSEAWQHIQTSHRP